LGFELESSIASALLASVDDELEHAVQNTITALKNTYLIIAALLIGYIFPNNSMIPG